MIHEVLSPRMEDGNHADTDAQALLCQLHEGLRGCLEEDSVDRPLVSQGKGVEWFGNGEDHMEVRNGEKLFPSCLKPLFFGEELALGTVSVPAGIVRYPYVPALFAFVDVSTESACSANLDGVHGAELVEGKAMGQPVRVTVAAEHLPDFDHRLRGVEGAGDSGQIFLTYMEIHSRSLG